jgi:AraC-like DNA-binding protein
MVHEARTDPAVSVERPAGAPAGRTIAQGEGWCVGEFTCRLGPWDRPFEERHDAVTIASVVAGTFQYRTAAGEALLYPGSFMLGNAGTCFTCRHEHSVGDRCIAVKLAPALFEEIAATIAGTHRFRFPAAMLPAASALAIPAVEAEISAAGRNPAAAEELAIRLAETVIEAFSGGAGAAAAPSSQDQRRVSRVLRHVEAHGEEPLDLAALAGIACMSKYHFLRTFHRILGVTPHQFLLGLRLRRAAIKLCTTALPVSAIAFDSGFGDLSAFNGRFRRVFGASPVAFRRARADRRIRAGRSSP